jgi:uncharacterized protein YlxP (DUF503 family)
MAVVVGICTLRLSIPDNADLKGKRRVLKSVIARLRDSFNVAVSEVDEQDKWQVATLAVVSVSNDAGRVHAVLTKAVESIEHSRLDAGVLDYAIEVL